MNREDNAFKRTCSKFIGCSTGSRSPIRTLNALLFRTGDQSKDIVLALATNSPGDLDSAVPDCIDEVLEFSVPGEGERFNQLKLYPGKYTEQACKRKPGWFSRLFQKQQHNTEIKGKTEEILKEPDFSFG